MAESRRLYDVIYDVLREHVLNESFPQGLVLSEAVVARAFGSSRVPAAAALERLRSEGLLKRFNGRGLIAAAASPDSVVRAELVDSGLKLPSEVSTDLKVRNHHGRIYPQIEHTIAASLSFGRFLVNESAMAEFYDVSRTVAHEVLTRLERAGLIAQEGNQRWYAGPLTEADFREHFEVRWLLEPVALGQSMDALPTDVVATRRAHTQKAMDQHLTPLRFEKLETELHVHTVLASANRQIVGAIRRSQLPVIPMHSTFAALPHADELDRALEEHLEIYDLVLASKKAAAMKALEVHVRRSLAPNIERLLNLGPVPAALRTPFLVPV